MAERTGTGATDRVQPSIFAKPIGNGSVVAVVGAGAAATGPWSYVTGIPNPNSDMLGPPPQYLSVAAWAA